MKITEDQIEALGAIQRDEFHARMTRRLATRFEKELLGHQITDVSEMVSKGLDFAEHYGLTRRGVVRRFLETMAVLGPDFHKTEAWASEILRDKITSQTARMDRIATMAIFNQGNAGT